MNQSRETILSLREKLQTELLKHQILGFDYVCQAVHAILTNEDWAERWDCLHEDCRGLIEAGNAFRKLMRK